MKLFIFLNNLIKNFKLALKSSYITSFSKSDSQNINYDFNKSDPENLFGVMYIVFGYSFNREAFMSIKSLNEYNNYPVCVLTDFPEIFSDLNLFMVKKIDKFHKRSKVDYISQSPFFKTLYLDSDTLVNSNLEDIEILLDSFDVCATTDSARKRNFIQGAYDTYEKIPYAFSEVNGGILAFKKTNKTKIFFKIWAEEYYNNNFITKNWDQPSLRVALWKSRVRLYVLPPEYNVRSKDHLNKNKHMKKLNRSLMRPRIYHSHYDKEVHNNIFKVEDYSKYKKIIVDKSEEIFN